jgi:hypothetical protein
MTTAGTTSNSQILIGRFVKYGFKTSSPLSIRADRWKSSRPTFASWHGSVQFLRPQCELRRLAMKTVRGHFHESAERIAVLQVDLRA